MMFLDWEVEEAVAAAVVVEPQVGEEVKVLVRSE